MIRPEIKNIGSIWIMGLSLIIAYPGHAQQQKSWDAQRFHKHLLADTTIQLIDVRTPIEHAERAIAGSILLNWKDSAAFTHGVQKLEKSRPVYVYCRSGNRSNMAADRLVVLGFKEVVNLSGGIKSWEDKGYPLYKTIQLNHKRKENHRCREEDLLKKGY
jgi:rhodanese-related sulfurtransferase